MTLKNSGMKRSMSCMNLISLNEELPCDQVRDYNDFKLPSPLHVEYDLNPTSRKNKKTKKQRTSLSTTYNPTSYNIVDPYVKECMKSKEELFSSWPTISLEESNSCTSCVPRSVGNSISKKEEFHYIPSTTNKCFPPSISDSSFESSNQLSDSACSLNDIYLSNETCINSQNHKDRSYLRPATIILDNQIKHDQNNFNKEDISCSCSHSLLTRLMERKGNTNCEIDFLVKPISPNESYEYISDSCSFHSHHDLLQNNEPPASLSTLSSLRKNASRMCLNENEFKCNFRTPRIPSVSPTCLREEMQLSRTSQAQKFDQSWTRDLHQMTEEFSRIHVPH